MSLQALLKYHDSTFDKRERWRSLRRSTLVASTLIAVFVIVATAAWLHDDLKVIKTQNRDYIRGIFAIADADNYANLASASMVVHDAAVVRRDVADLAPDVNRADPPTVMLVKPTDPASIAMINLPDGLIEDNMATLLADAGRAPLDVRDQQGREWELALSQQLEDGHYILAALPTEKAMTIWRHRVYLCSFVAGLALLILSGIVYSLLRVQKKFRWTLLRYKRANVRATAANRAKSNFLAQMSHELRTPLNAILGFSELIHRELYGSIGAAIYKECAHNIHTAGRHLLDLINTILDLAKIESGHGSINAEAFGLDRVIDEAIVLTSPLAGNRQISLDRHPLSTGLTVNGDPSAVLRILINLIGNAIKFSPASSKIELTVSRTADKSLVICVVDQGPGIPQAKQGRLFIPFAATEADATTTVNRTGLGLPIARKLMQLHDGELQIQSVEGQGTAASMVFPAQRVSDAATDPVSSKTLSSKANLQFGQ